MFRLSVRNNVPHLGFLHDFRCQHVVDSRSSFGTNQGRPFLRFKVGRGFEMTGNNGAHELRNWHAPSNGAPETLMWGKKQASWRLVLGLGFLAGIALGLGLYTAIL